jgi:hypothetical protein
VERAISVIPLERATFPNAWAISLGVPFLQPRVEIFDDVVLAAKESAGSNGLVFKPIAHAPRKLLRALDVARLAVLVSAGEHMIRVPSLCMK